MKDNVGPETSRMHNISGNGQPKEGHVGSQWGPTNHSPVRGVTVGPRNHTLERNSRTQENPGDSVVCVTRGDYHQVMGVEVNAGPKNTGAQGYTGDVVVCITGCVVQVKAGPKVTQGPMVTQGGCAVQRRMVRVTYRKRDTTDEPRIRLG
ncbi:hypothetical protein DFH28DRAFT_931618 [Melampsora americana]|nr:hypothetical protein DFH28DRAFT_931618 [Melampsora americana]